MTKLKGHLTAQRKNEAEWTTSQTVDRLVVCTYVCMYVCGVTGVVVWLPGVVLRQSLCASRNCLMHKTMDWSGRVCVVAQTCDGKPARACVGCAT